MLEIMEMREGYLADINEVLERSQPRRRVPWVWYGAGALLLVVMGWGYLGEGSEGGAALVEVAWRMLMLGVMAGLVVVTVVAVRGQRLEQQRLQILEELVQLRRWEEAAGIVGAMLWRPMRSVHGRFQALIFLSSVLARWNRFADAITVQSYLLEHVELDAGTAQGLRLGRAMAMLRDDRLFDADGAIAELRNSSGVESSGGLALVRMYRDVKTGHPHEAIEIFREQLANMREQLGHRVGDAYGLVAKAYDVLGQEQEAGVAYGNATVLCAAEELVRRYPEIGELQRKYGRAEVPLGGCGKDMGGFEKKDCGQ